MFQVKGKYSTATIMIDDVEHECLSQIVAMTNHPALSNPIAIMPDTHSGKGSVIGFTMPMSNQLIPEIIGVDIACGMLSQKLNDVTLLPDRSLSTPRGNLSRISVNELIRDIIPFGKEVYDYNFFNMERFFPWNEATELNRKFVIAYKRKTGYDMPITNYDYKWFAEKCKQIGMSQQRAERSIGTLGSGNHFCEFNQSLTDKSIWATVHTGSRQLGKCICEYWQHSPARRDAEETKKKLQDGIVLIKKTYSGKEIQTQISKLKKELGIDQVKTNFMVHLARTEDMYGYLTDMIFASIYAQVNRQVIMRVITDVMSSRSVGETIETVHNYIDFNDFVIRKGAIAAYKDHKCLIPFNMEDGILVCEGLSNPEWNFSAPHGAGRVMSRAKAKKELDISVAVKRMKDNGIFSSSIPLDETKEAYKDPKVIEDAIGPTVKIIDRLIPIMNLKDGSGEE